MDPSPESAHTSVCPAWSVTTIQVNSGGLLPNQGRERATVTGMVTVVPMAGRLMFPVPVAAAAVQDDQLSPDSASLPSA